MMRPIKRPNSSQKKKASWWAFPPELTYSPRRKWLKNLGPGKNVVTILCDTGERYISIEKYFNI